MKINRLDTNHLRNSLHFQFHTEFFDLTDKEKDVAASVKSLLDVYAALYHREDEALKKIVKSSLTQKIREADRERDKTLAGTVELVGSMCKHFNPLIADAAFRIQVVLDAYKTDISKSMNSETSAIYNLLQELDLPKYGDDRINCNLNPWLNELKNRNEALEHLMKERYDENAFKTDIVLKDARREIDGAYRRIVEQINALVLVEGLTKYESFVRRLNAVIEKYSIKKAVRSRDTEEEEEGEEEEQQ